MRWKQSGLERPISMYWPVSSLNDNRSLVSLSSTLNDGNDTRKKGEGFIFLIIFASHVTRDKEVVFVNVQFPEVAHPHVGSHSQICWRSALHSARVATNNLNWILNWILKTQGT